MLDRPAPEAAARLAEQFLHRAARAARRLSAEPESLHDFRVALRRLRAHLKTYRPLLGKAAGKTVRRRLSHMSRATNAAREAAVAGAWLKAIRLPRSAERERKSWMRETRHAARVSGRERRALEEEFDAARRRLKKKLTRLSFKTARPFRLEWRERMEDGLRRLDRELSAVTSARDVALIHRARITAKTLRYAAESSPTAVAGERTLIAALKSIQRRLGDLHDLELLEGTANARLARRADVSPASKHAPDLAPLIAVEKAFRRRETALFAAFVRQRAALRRKLKL